MSTPDARLTAAERAALADLEAAAAAADPSLAARLKGRTAWLSLPVLHSARRTALRAWEVVLGAGWWGLAVTAIGLFLVVLGLGVTLALSFVGAVAAGLGLRILAEMVIRASRGRAPEA